MQVNDGDSVISEKARRHIHAPTVTGGLVAAGSWIAADREPTGNARIDAGLARGVIGID
jgi:hypothetical protein